MKKKFWDTVVGRITERIIVIAVGLVLKNRKGIKGTPLEDKVDEVFKV